MCINQYYNTEEGSQVQMMRDIYATATRTIIWLGKGTKATSAAFNFVADFNSARLEGRDAFWQNRDSKARIADSRRNFNYILDYEWWERAWFIQEVVVSSQVLFQSGSHQIKWEDFYNLLVYLTTGDDGPTVAFDKHVQRLRDPNAGTESTPTSLLDLAYAFRYQSATFGSDKIYALLGLLPAGNTCMLQPKYNETPERVFMQFTVSCLKHNKDSRAITYASGVPLQGGYSADVVDRVGDFNPEIHSSMDWSVVLGAWKRVARVNGAEQMRMFNRMITADCWAQEPLDWRQRIPRRGDAARHEEDTAYLKLVNKVCSNRRSFVTQCGQFRLGLWDLRKSDIVCILFGGKTPLIIRQCAARRGQVSGDIQQASLFHKVVGEAYVDGLMYYEGNMQDDIASSKIRPGWFHLL
ncbi:hypothetical protein CC86DRAFT_469746 [Ophiobolus disseminans]|uniref:Heterokaryon incompatibility domain-containing protein n=1 Tax=Ophiobolus disseminans TaxID=1469910 RepID=A0A6A6ZPL2_9PLEO|nr:hypothetical protein CC86DRAFT_469746 [Ophiobolus disseminans]